MNQNGGNRVQYGSDPKDLEMPESIRTPGRTWTRYPDLKDVDTFSPEVSIEKEGDVEVLKGEHAVEKSGEKLLEAIKPSENRINAVHSLKLDSVLLVRCSGTGKVSIKKEADHPYCSHLVIIAEQSAEVTVTEEFKGNTEELLTGFTEIYVGENATVRYGSLEAAEGELHYFRRKAIVEDHGRIEWLNGKFGGELSRTLVETALKGDGSEAEKLATWYPTDEQHLDTSLHVRHIGEDTKCQMDSRAVVDDKSRSVYEGLQKVERHAENTSSFQDEEVLSLSDKAEVDASPKLMIENPEVEASHAASAGNIDKEVQHYVETRGLDKESAEQLVVKGYFEPVLEEIDMPEMKELIRNQVRLKLKR